MAIMSAMTPTAIPAFAPVDNPLELLDSSASSFSLLSLSVSVAPVEVGAAEDSDEELAEELAEAVDVISVVLDEDTASVDYIYVSVHSQGC